MPRVVLLISTDHGDHELQSESMEPQAVREWLKKIDAALGSVAATVETDWATALKSKVVGAYISD